MPNFGEVFSTTWKVLLALVLISLGVSMAYFVVGAVSRGGSEYSSGEWLRKNEEKTADEAASKMPQSQWEREVKRCIEQHKVIEGMTKEQVKEAVGGNDPWTYSIVTSKGVNQPCLRYEGERCVEFPPDEVKYFNLHFTPKGSLIWDSDSIGLSIYAKYQLLPSAQPATSAQKP